MERYASSFSLSRWGIARAASRVEPFYAYVGGEIPTTNPVPAPIECEKIGEHLSGMRGIREVKVLQYHDLSASRYEALGLPCTLPKVVTTAADVERAVEILRGYRLNAINGITDS